MPLPIGKTIVNANSDEPYYIIPIPGAIYQWTVIAGTITAGQGSPQIMVRWGSDSTQGRVDLTTSSPGTPNNPPTTDGITIVIDPDEGGDHGKGHNG